jgi:hypothetical protein
MESEARKELIERYKLAYAEYRGEVALGTERQRIFITLAPAVAAFVSSRETAIAVAAFLLSAAASVVGILLVHRSHTRYQATRSVVFRLGDQLGWDDLRTTGGMREAHGDPRLEYFKVTGAVKFLLGLYAAFDLIAAAVLLWSAFHR